MIKIFGKAMLATWRPYESGGSSHLRSSQMESESVTVIDQTVIAQHPDGFWETFPLANCSINWRHKPVFTIINTDGTEVPLIVAGKDHTLADQIADNETVKKARFQPAPNYVYTPPAENKDNTASEPESTADSDIQGIGLH